MSLFRANGAKYSKTCNEMKVKMHADIKTYRWVLCYKYVDIKKTIKTLSNILNKPFAL